MMNLNQLRALYCVVKTGSFAKAAEELFVTEPAVYIQVRSLERDMGFTLLDRFGKELHPTEMGKLLYNYGEKIFSLVEEATQAVHELQDLKRGSLRLGAAKALAQYMEALRAACESARGLCAQSASADFRKLRQEFIPPKRGG